MLRLLNDLFSIEMNYFSFFMISLMISFFKKRYIIKLNCNFCRSLKANNFTTIANGTFDQLISLNRL